MKVDSFRSFAGSLDSMGLGHSADERRAVASCGPVFSEGFAVDRHNHAFGFGLWSHLPGAVFEKEEEVWILVFNRRFAARIRVFTASFYENAFFLYQYRRLPQKCLVETWAPIPEELLG